MTVSIDFDALFDADQLRRGGECPWTIFAYPTNIADSRGLPPGNDATMLLAELQKRGIPMAIWVNGVSGNTTYFACRYADRFRIDQAICELENLGILETHFLSQHSEQLFSLGHSST